MAGKLSDQIKHENVANRDAIALVGDSVASLSDKFDQRLNLLEEVATTGIHSVSALRQDHTENHHRLLQELSVAQNSISDLRYTARGVEMDMVRIREVIAANSATPLSLLRKDHAESELRILQELALTRETLGRLIAKPAQLKQVCEVLKETSSLRAFPNPHHNSPISLARRTCVCRKRVARSRQVRLWGPWRTLADTTTVKDHLPSCIYHIRGRQVSTVRWAVGFTGLQRLMNRAVEVSFSYTFGAGGFSLSPGFRYYPTVDHRRDPAFRIMALVNWAFWHMGHDQLRVEEFAEQCIESIGLLYRHGRASARAVDQYGRSVLYYCARSNTSLDRLDALIKHGMEAATYDIHGLCARIPASLLIYVTQLTSLSSPEHLLGICYAQR
jgi:hypothetical protein